LAQAILAQASVAILAQELRSPQAQLGSLAV